METKYDQAPIQEKIIPYKKGGLVIDGVSFWQINENYFRDFVCLYCEKAFFLYHCCVSCLHYVAVQFYLPIYHKEVCFPSTVSFSDVTTGISLFTRSSFENFFCSHDG